LRDQCARIGGETISFRAGETIHTENSYKFSVEQFQAVARRCGFEAVQAWTDPCKRFSLHWLEAK
jgi:uncharacterized SAM-dependent methyltransferase